MEDRALTLASTGPAATRAKFGSVFCKLIGRVFGIKTV